MDLDKFKQSIASKTPPPQLTTLLKALWLDKKGNWDEAHHLADSMSTEDAAWVHAYLHRKEGDIWNADYWYRRANKPRPHYDLHKEWEQIVKALLN